jgi:1-phosphofructokinase family hexose kinase
MEGMLRDRGIETHFTWVEGETRLNTVLVAADQAVQTTITTNTLCVNSGHMASLMQTYENNLEKTSCVILGGPWPAGLDPAAYREMILAARLRHLPVILDASGEALKAGLPGHPTVIKPNRDELEGLAGRPLLTLEDVYRFSVELQSAYGCAIVVTLGMEGALAILPDQCYRIPPLDVEVVNAAGAGDAVTAGLAAALSRQNPWEEGLRLGFAAAGAVVQTEGTACCQRDKIDGLYPKIRLQTYPPR